MLTKIMKQGDDDGTMELQPVDSSSASDPLRPTVGTPRRSISLPSRPTPTPNGSTRHKVTSRNKVRRFRDWAVAYVVPGRKMDMTRRELMRKYQLHFFVFLIFLATVISVSLSWYYRELSLRMLQSTQTIFFDPRKRLLTLTDPTHSVSIEGHLGLDMPKWQLPLHCPVVVGEDPSSRQCEWKNNARLSINQFGNAYVQCYNVSWDSLHPNHVPYDCFNVKYSTWYGPSNQSESTFPIGGHFSYKPTNQRLDSNGIFSYVEDFYWLSSTGMALRIHGNDPIHISWNETGDGKLCILSNHTGPLYHQTIHSHLEYTVCNGINPTRTQAYMHENFPPSNQITFPPDEAFRGYFWSFKGFSSQYGGNNISQESIVDFARQLKSFNQSNAKIIIDTRWQASHGDLTFDTELFPNISDMVSTLEDLNTHLTMVVSPSIYHKSVNFEQSIDASRFVLDASGDVAGLVKGSDGVAAIVNVFNIEARDWYQQMIKAFVNQLPDSSIRLTYGQAPWLPYKPHFDSVGGCPKEHRTQITEILSQISQQPLVVEHTSNTRHVPHFIPVHTRVVIQSDDRKCLVGAIESALTLGLMGYPFVILESPDLSKSILRTHDESTDQKELYIRWLQLATFFPAAQISVPPWTYDSELLIATQNMSRLREQLVIPLLQNQELRQQVVTKYMPILRPVWWLDSSNRTVHAMKQTDEFLIGDHVLVAPVLCTGTRSRDIYVPPGVWEDQDYQKYFLGPTVLRDYPVPLDDIVVLHRHKVEGETLHH